MRDPLFVGRSQSRSALNRNLKKLISRDWLRCTKTFAKGIALDELHDEKHVCAGFDHIVDASNVLMLEHDGPTGFVDQPPSEFEIASQNRRGTLQSEWDTKSDVIRQVDFAHARRAEAFSDEIFSGNDRPYEFVTSIAEHIDDGFQHRRRSQLICSFLVLQKRLNLQPNVRPVRICIVQK